MYIGIDSLIAAIDLGVSDWLMIAVCAVVLVALIVVALIAAVTMSNVKRSYRSLRAARVVVRAEVVDGYCCIVAENVGNELASKVRVNCKGSIVDYYRKYCKRNKLTDKIKKELMSGSLSLVPHEKRYVKLFPIPGYNGKKIVLGNDRGIKTETGDFNFLDAQSIDDDGRIYIDEIYDKSDAKVAEKANKASVKELARESKRAQKNEKKAAKKSGEHITSLDVPYKEKTLVKGDLYFNYTWVTLGVTMHNSYGIKKIDLKHYPEEFGTAKQILRTQNELLDGILLLQKQIKESLSSSYYDDKNV